MSTPSPLQRWRQELAQQLERWALALRAAPAAASSADPDRSDRSGRSVPQASLAESAPAPTNQPADAADAAAGTAPTSDVTDPEDQCPASRPPLSLEQAVRQRSLRLLQREAADALAALAGAHALVSSARFSQLQELRQQVAAGAMPQDMLNTLAADYQGWHSDQVRLFDALALVLRMRIPRGKALDQVGETLQQQCLEHLASLSADYQRGLLERQLQQQPAASSGDASSGSSGEDAAGDRDQDQPPQPAGG
jgi:hypothetical protein